MRRRIRIFALCFRKTGDALPRGCLTEMLFRAFPGTVRFFSSSAPRKPGAGDVRMKQSHTPFLSQNLVPGCQRREGVVIPSRYLTFHYRRALAACHRCWGIVVLPCHPHRSFSLLYRGLSILESCPPAAALDEISDSHFRPVNRSETHPFGCFPFRARTLPPVVQYRNPGLLEHETCPLFFSLALSLLVFATRLLSSFPSFSKSTELNPQYVRHAASRGLPSEPSGISVAEL
jgi:hypothetical protein